MAAQNAVEGAGTFNLTGDSNDFQSKKTDVFGSLDAIEKSYQSNLAGRSESGLDGNLLNSSDGVEDNGGFKRPRSPGSTPGSRNARSEFRSKAWSRRDDFKWRSKEPEFEKNPNKWKRYSLEETSVCGNAQNSRVAFDVIRQLKERREEEEGSSSQGSSTADLEQRVVFSKPEARPSSTEKKTVCSDVHKMQEYNFGVKAPKRRAQTTPLAQDDSDAMESTSNATLSFQHLADEQTEYSVTKDKSGDATSANKQSDSDDAQDAVASPGQEMNEGSDQKCSEDVPATVGFKKRRGKQNIRHRQEDGE